MTLKDTPSIVTASGVAGLEFADEVQTANKLVPVLKRKGVKAIVVLIHQGGVPDKQKWTDPATGTSYDVNPDYDYTCGKGGTLAASSPILPIAANLDPAIDMVISGHTHQPYVCDVKDPVGRPRLLTSRLVVRPAVHRDRPALQPPHARHRAQLGQGHQHACHARRHPGPAQTSLIDLYKTLVTPIASKVIGHITSDVTRRAERGGGERPRVT